MTESNRDLTKKVQEWLESQGYPLEMLVARTFKQAGAYVQQSSYYLDTETEKSREIDVHAKWYRAHETLWGLIELQLFFLVECKSQQKSPWILFSTGPKEHRSYLRPPTSPDGKILLNWMDTDELRSVFELQQQVSYGVTQAFTSGKDVPYEAVMSAAKAAVAEIIYHDDLRKEFKEDEEDYAIRLGVDIAIPVVVTDAPLFQCYLAENDALMINQVDSGLIEWKYLFGYNSKISGIPVYIYTIHAINNFVDYAKDFENRLSNFLPKFITELYERRKNKEDREID